ncbi:hypothetical protein BA950_03875 [Erythrobacter sp. SAORIC-644]|jgi:hypothetical protein|nr:hypothetical protein BA950_03875 [Erythrobacter sp. SAORIC-644]|tara:strand:+ start:614 stop:820 length:207 start_codon:yes stop_codon:yes gene_type:complete
MTRGSFVFFTVSPVKTRQDTQPYAAMIRSYACLVSSALVRLSRPCNLGDAKASVLQATREKSEKWCKI